MANKLYWVVVYKTSKPDWEIDRYVNGNKLTSENDVAGTYFFPHKNKQEAENCYQQLKEKSNVVALFEDSDLLIVANKNR